MFFHFTSCFTTSSRGREGDLNNTIQAANSPIGKAQVDQTRTESASVAVRYAIPESLPYRAMNFYGVSTSPGSAQGTASRKRQSETTDEADSVKVRPAKRQEATFKSDYFSDDALQLLLDAEHFAEVSGRPDVEPGESN